MAQWQIFLDESGEFSKNQTTWLAGWAVQGPATPSQDKKLRAALQSAYPGVPWPMHATRENQPISHALYRLAKVPAPPHIEARCAPAVTALTGSSSPIARAFVAAAHAAAAGFGKGGRVEIDRDISDAATLWLQEQDPGALELLWRIQKRQHSEMLEVLRSLAIGTHGARAFALVVESDPADADHLGPTRWREAFEILLSRATDLIRASDGPGDQILVRAAAYDGVRNRHLGAISGKLHTAPWFPTTAPCVVFPTKPQPYAEQTLAGVVVADYLANRIGRHLHGGLGLVAARVSRELGLPLVRVPTSAPRAPELPACAATGASHRALVAARHGSAATIELRTGREAWKVDQALAWMHAQRGGAL